MFYTIPFISMGFITVCGIILFILFVYVQKRRKKSGKVKFSVAKSLSPHEIQLSQDFQKNLFFLKRIAQQISEHRRKIEAFALNNHFDFKKHAFKKLESFHSSMQETLYASIHQQYLSRNEQAEEVSKILETVENDFSIFKNQFHALVSCIKVNKPQQGSHSGIVTSILTEAMEDFRKLISENRSREKKMFQTISRFLQQSQADINKEVILFSSVVDSNKNFDEENFKLTLDRTLNRMERMKKNLKSAHTLLSQQHSKFSKIKEAVTHLNQEFLCFETGFDKVWKQNKIAKFITCRQLTKAEFVCTSLTEKTDTNANLLLQQAKIFTRIILDVKNVLTMNKLNFDCSSQPTSKQVKERSLEFSNSIDTAWIDNVDVLNQKLENLLHISENSKDKVESLKCTSNNFENFHDLIKSITRGYNTLLRFFLSTLGRSPKFHCPLKTKQNEETDENNTETYNKDNYLRKMIQINENSAGDVNVWDEVRNEMDVNLQNVDIHHIAFLIKDIMKATRERLYEGQVISGKVCEKDAVQSGDYKQWGDFPSESLLTDVSSEFLIHSSDESTCSPSEINLEG